MAVDAAIAASVVASQLNVSLLALRTQIENESATVNLVRDAVRQVQETNAASERRTQERLVDVFV